MVSAPTRQAPSTSHDTHRTPSSLHVAYVEPRALPSLLHSMSAPKPMAVISFGYPLSHDIPCPVIVPNLPQIAGSPLIEVWTSDRLVHTTTDGNLALAMNGEWLIGTISLDERPGQSLESLTCDAYQRILSHINEAGYPSLCRVWNYIPRINEEQDGLERYRRFCVGRHHALAERLPGFPDSLPAATAVGTKSGPLQMLFLASIKQPTHLGNPRQVHAYEYPLDYGPRSPSFARATLWQSERNTMVFLAGTASVVGHASQHIDSPIDQTYESIRNVIAVLEQANTICVTDFLKGSAGTLYKVYVRHPDTFPAIIRALHTSPLPAKSFLFLQGDLCRRELLIELEGVIVSESSAP